MIIDDKIIQNHLKYLQDLINWFNQKPCTSNRLLLEGATQATASLFNCAYNIHFSAADHDFLTYIRLYRGPELLVDIPALVTDKINIPEGSELLK